ncbi:MAG: trbL/VirB6 plasmid conjugal transfer family protein [Candidatus Xenolissoclinum pacificiensis L6]|uniref:TrbL/VirB6 plasmid conjugal transfer family protein n=1 Tax=Candidatus Xenolissoclinum pacificiensis L6 TaxID=1401685 RepID=W2V048_9RICK|nr:MAG: trbL/VirB6 plasmid conjugal transfer family protein [Candidatus Xenolissoclinum pacificiensis L6]
MGRLYFLLIVIIISGSFTSCGTVSGKKCIEADDFGASQEYNISAYYPIGDPAFSPSAEPITGDSLFDNQVIRWQDLNLFTNGADLVISIDGSWTGWTGLDGQDTAETPDYNKECKYISKPAYNTCESDCLTCDIDSTPCWLKRGYGLYLLLVAPNEGDPNATLQTMRYPNSVMIHLAINTNDPKDNLYVSNRGTVIDNHCNPFKIPANYRIYAKILDNYYQDNIGSYSITFKKGVKETDAGGLLERAREKIYTLIFLKAKDIFIGVVEDTAYLNLIKYAIVLYISVRGLMILLGLTQNMMHELSVMMFKMLLVLLFLTPGSWNFWYNNFFVLFMDGVNFMISKIASAAIPSAYDPEHPFRFIDYLLMIIFSNEVWGGKIQALMVSDILAIFWIIGIIAVIALYVVAVIESFMIYMTGMLGIFLLVIISPIFFIAVLFGVLKDSFDQWLKQIIGFSLQIIMMFTLLSIFGYMILNHFYRTLGFKVCHTNYLILGFSENLMIGSVASYVPGDGELYVPYSFRDLSYKRRHTFSGGLENIWVPPEYSYRDYRYVDLPYFDPDVRYDYTHQVSNAPLTDLDIKTKGHDAKVIYQFLNERITVDFLDFAILLLLSVLLLELRVFVQQAAAAISGASPFTSVLGMGYRQGMIGGTLSSVSNMALGLPGMLFDKAKNALGYGKLTDKFTSYLQEHDMEKTATVVRKVSSGVSNYADKISSTISIGQWLTNTESEAQKIAWSRYAYRHFEMYKATVGHLTDKIKIGTMANDIGASIGGIGDSWIAKYDSDHKVRSGFFTRRSSELAVGLGKIYEETLGMSLPESSNNLQSRLRELEQEMEEGNKKDKEEDDDLNEEKDLKKDNMRDNDSRSLSQDIDSEDIGESERNARNESDLMGRSIDDDLNVETSEEDHENLDFQISEEDEAHLDQIVGDFEESRSTTDTEPIYDDPTTDTEPIYDAPATDTEPIYDAPTTDDYTSGEPSDHSYGQQNLNEVGDALAGAQDTHYGGNVNDDSGATPDELTYDKPENDDPTTDDYTSGEPSDHSYGQQNLDEVGDALAGAQDTHYGGNVNDDSGATPDELTYDKPENDDPTTDDYTSGEPSDHSYGQQKPDEVGDALEGIQDEYSGDNTNDDSFGDNANDDSSFGFDLDELIYDEPATVDPTTDDYTSGEPSDHSDGQQNLDEVGDALAGAQDTHYGGNVNDDSGATPDELIYDEPATIDPTTVDYTSDESSENAEYNLSTDDAIVQDIMNEESGAEVIDDSAKDKKSTEDSFNTEDLIDTHAQQSYHDLSKQEAYSSNTDQNDNIKEEEEDLLYSIIDDDLFSGVDKKVGNTSYDESKKDDIKTEDALSSDNTPDNLDKVEDVKEANLTEVIKETKTLLSGDNLNDSQLVESFDVVYDHMHNKNVKSNIQRLLKSDKNRRNMSQSYKKMDSYAIRNKDADLSARLFEFKNAFGIE